MNRYGYNYLLVGANGQIGRHLLRELSKQGSVAVVMRPTLNRLTPEDGMLTIQKYVSGPVDVFIGDVMSMELPVAEHVVNAAANTNVGSARSPFSLFQMMNDNVFVATALAHHAANTGAMLHHLSTVSVATGRTSVMFEKDWANPYRDMGPYTMSKTLGELSVESIMPARRLSIYRCPDVVPMDIESEWRRDHWLSLLYSCGKRGFPSTTDIDVWIAQDFTLAVAITRLMDGPGARHHVLGNKYHWDMFRRTALDSDDHGLRMFERFGADLVDKIGSHPVARMINSWETVYELDHKGFTWIPLSDAYWREFGVKSWQEMRKSKGSN